ncbi:carbohydrate ABC transporter permease [Amygdalobacter nucleatus]|uniref:ABC transporter, permease protein n=1 Tax=Amygdalobacter nucleatus TaxID=3029274 RepID=A0A133YAK9_9FIRM|nr:carbohydrate ABC transporter permease [Amygdalobacter nucleatus]KXB40223.1 ABC transporter, permease protein [Amygdalobacter nucleatus]MDF0485752.1 carbohydrate ABC transporter permease [Amygdalobacter nucleatus]WEG36415.1 carbohydrate ABC transporter permease [Amygdalobacter nucleatus]
MMKHKFNDYIFQVLCLLVAFIVIFPILYAIAVSFMNAEDILARPPHFLPPSITLENYKVAFTRTLLGRYIFNSFIVALISSLSRIILGAMAAYAFVFFEFKGKKFLFMLSLCTMMVPAEVVLVSNFTTVSRLGLINTYLGVCIIFLVSANNIFILRQNFMTLDKSLWEVAQLDGCSRVKFFGSVLLPVAKPVVITIFLSSFVNLWNQYVWPLVVTSRNEMRTIQVGITMLKDRESTAFGPVMAGVVISLLFTVLIFALFQRKIVAGMMSGSSKG